MERIECRQGANNRVALLVGDLSGRGVQRNRINLATELDRQGLNVDLVLIKAQGIFLNQVPNTVRIIDLGASRAIRALPALTRYLRRERPQAMISAENHSNVIALLARCVARYPKQITVSTHVPPTLWAANRRFWSKKYVHRQFIRMTYPMATARIALSAGMADEMSEVFGLHRASISILYNPVVTSTLLKAAEGPAPHPWLNTDQPPVILGVGSLRPHKGFDILIPAFAELRRERRIRLMILGEGPEKERLLRLANELGVAQDVCLAGFVSNPIRYMAWADLFALSSRFEGLPTVLIEALASGCPVVATRCSGGTVEILEDGVYGPLVPVEETGALAAAMSRRLATPRNSESLKNRAQAFHVERIVEQYRKILGI